VVHDTDGAIAAYRHAIMVNPKDRRAFNALGETYVKQRNIDEGVANLRKATSPAT
jgi:hypothetical protein